MARTDPQFNLRLPQDLKERIEFSAAASGRSATAEIVFRLEESFKEHPDLREMIKRIESNIAELDQVTERAHRRLAQDALEKPRSKKR